jgi:polyhydroxybutyrate depolymerase
MRYAWVISGCLAGCSTVSPLEETLETGSSSSSSATAPATGSGGTDAPSGPGDTDPSASNSEPQTDPGGTATTIPEGATTADPLPPTSEPDMTSGTSGTTDATTDATTGETPTEGCGADPGAEGPQDRMVVVEGTDRHYIVVVPPGYDPNTAHPVVFAWHGRGGSGMLARLYFGVEEASAGAAIVVYPDGLPLPDMMNQTGWDLMADGEDVAFFDAMLADVESTLCVDAERVFSTGHSFGGFMSNSLGCFRGETVRAIAPVAGGGPYGQCTGQVATWIAHGTLDEVVPFMFGEMSRDSWAAANGCDASMSEAVDPAPCVAFLGCDAGFPVHWCEHDIPDFMGHTWPAWAGEGIWSFFAGL